MCLPSDERIYEIFLHVHNSVKEKSATNIVEISPHNTLRPHPISHQINFNFDISYFSIFFMILPLPYDYIYVCPKGIISYYFTCFKPYKCYICLMYFASYPFFTPHYSWEGYLLLRYYVNYFYSFICIAAQYSGLWHHNMATRSSVKSLLYGISNVCHTSHAAVNNGVCFLEYVFLSKNFSMV